MIYTILKEHWEEGSRPGRMKVNTTYSHYVFEARDEDHAQEVLQKIFAHQERISYHQVRFIAAYLFEGDVSELANPFVEDVSEKVGKFQLNRRKHWYLYNESERNAHFQWQRGSERPGYWANLHPNQQRAVALADRLSPELAEVVARTFQRSNMPI